MASLNNNPKVYIIILNYNGWKDTIECVESILKTSYDNYQLIIVDNDSGDHSVEYILKWAGGKLLAETSSDLEISQLVNPFIHKPINISVHSEDEEILSKASVILIKAKNNRGFSSGNNIGIKLAIKDKDLSYIWLLNNDTVVPPDTLAKLVTFHQEQSKLVKVGLVGSPLIHYYKPELVQAYAGKLNLLTCHISHLGENISRQEPYPALEYDYPIGASLFLSLDYINEVGLMDEGYFLYFEELDWTVRGKKKGWQPMVANSAFIFHKLGTSTGNNNALERSSFSDEVLIKSKIRFLKKHFPFYQIFPVLFFPMVILNRVMRKQYNRIPALITALFTSLVKKS